MTAAGPDPIADLASPSEPCVITGAAGVRLLGSRCRDCGARFFPTRQVCFACTGRKLEETLLGPEGRLYSYTTVHVAPERMTPYTIGYVDLDEGVRVLAPIQARRDELRPDQRVHLVAAEDGTWAVVPGEGTSR